MATSYSETFGVKIWRNPTESMLTELEVLKWKKWGCDPSKFPWSFDSGSEKMYFLKGKVKVYCEGHEGYFVIGAGDLVEFPKGMSVEWDVVEAMEKYYLVEDQ